MFFVGLILGAIIGGSVGGMVMAFFCIAKNADLQDENDRLRAAEFAK